MARALDQDIVDYIDANVAGWTKYTNLFEGPLRPAEDGIPVECVFVVVTAGLEPLPFIDGNPTSYEERAPFAQVSIRSAPDAYYDGLTKARAIRDALHDAVLHADYELVRVRESEPIYLGRHDRDAHLFVINIETRITE